MICNKCGANIEANVSKCPRCGQQLKKKSKVKVIISILIGILIVAGIGCGLYIWKPYNKSASDTIESENVQETGNIVEQDSVEIKEAEEAISTVEEVDEDAKLFQDMTFEDLEMVIGSTYEMDRDMSIAIVFESDNDSIISISEKTLKAKQPGSARVTARYGEMNKEFTVSVSKFPDTTVAVGYSKEIEINDEVGTVNWESSDENIVSIDNGVLFGIDKGSAEISASIGEETYTFEVVTTTPELSTTSFRHIIGKEEKIEVFGTNGSVEWKSDNTAIATVSEDGTIYAEPSGAGQNTTVHAYVDGMDIPIDVVVEAVPQLLSTYKIYGYDPEYDASITLCANSKSVLECNYKKEDRHEITLFTSDGQSDKYMMDTVTPDFGMKDNITLSEYDFKEMNYPIYRAYGNGSIDLYVVGSGQNADVTVQHASPKRHADTFRSAFEYISLDTDKEYTEIDGNMFIGSRRSILQADSFEELKQAVEEDVNKRMVFDYMKEEDIPSSGLNLSYTDAVNAVYEPHEDYGIVHVEFGNDYFGNLDTAELNDYNDSWRDEFYLITIVIDGEVNSVVVGGVSKDSRFDYDGVNDFTIDYVIEELSVGDEQKVQQGNSSQIYASSSVFSTGSDWIDNLGSKFIETAQDKAIDMAVDSLFSLFF